MKFTQLKALVFESLVTEARNPKLKYTDKVVKDKLERVTVALESTDSAAMSRLAKRYVRLDASLKAMQEKRNELNSHLKETVEGMFDAEDAVVTRVVETVSFSLVMAKEVAKDIPASSKVDYEKLAGELAKLIPAELQDKVQELTKLYTKIIPASTKPGVKSISVTPLEEGVGTTLKSLIKSLVNGVKQFTRWATGYDKKLGALEARFKEIKSRKA